MRSSTQKAQVLCIVGPTAVGKSAVAEAVAGELGGAVVSVDSMQVYRGMDIGTAKMPPSERRQPLLMVDVANVDEPYSVSLFQSEARACIQGVLDSGGTPVLCGGTGLYLDAVIDDMHFPHGEQGSDSRARYEEMARAEGPEALYALLVSRDPQSASRIHPHNVRRVVRALEMLDEGISYAEQHEGLKRRNPFYSARIWALTLPRELLYERIDRRVDEMFDRGLVQEVKALRERGLTLDSTAGMAIGYKEILQALENGEDIQLASETIKRNTRRYAKRQLSWIRRDGRATWLDMDLTSVQEAVQAICDDWRSRDS